MDGADKLSAPYNRAAPWWAAPPFPTVFAPVSRRVRFLSRPAVGGSTLPHRVHPCEPPCALFTGTPR